MLNISVGTSSIKKGETLIDTAMTLNAMQPDILVVRHHDAGAVKLLSEKVNCGVINAGDGPHEHPTQALLDALTILKRKNKYQVLKLQFVVIFFIAELLDLIFIYLILLELKLELLLQPH